MSRLPQSVEVKDPGHAPFTTASTTPGHAPVDATLANRFRRLDMWAKTVERNAATKVGKDDFSTMEGIEKLLDEHIQDFMQILGGDWPDMPKEITVATVCTGSAQDTVTLVASQGIRETKNARHQIPLLIQLRECTTKAAVDKFRPQVL